MLLQLGLMSTPRPDIDTILELLITTELDVDILMPLILKPTAHESINNCSQLASISAPLADKKAG